MLRGAWKCLFFSSILRMSLHAFCRAACAAVILRHIAISSISCSSSHRFCAPLQRAGDKRLFIRHDELEAAWALFTPVLHELEAKGVAPELYPYGSRGPLGAHYLGAKYGVRWGDLAADDA